MKFKKGQVVRGRISRRVFIVADDQQGGMVEVRYVISGRRVCLPPEILTLIGNNYTPLKPRGVMDGIPQRSTKEAPPRHWDVTDKLRGMMEQINQRDKKILEMKGLLRGRDSSVGELEEQVGHLEFTLSIAKDCIRQLTEQLAEAQRKKKWWNL